MNYKSDTYTEAFNKVYKRLYYNDFSDIRELWNIKNLNELQENTNLQKLIKMELLNGTIFKMGIGVLIS